MASRARSAAGFRVTGRLLPRPYSVHSPIFGYGLGGAGMPGWRIKRKGNSAPLPAAASGAAQAFARSAIRFITSVTEFGQRHSFTQRKTSFHKATCVRWNDGEPASEILSICAFFSPGIDGIASKTARMILIVLGRSITQRQLVLLRAMCAASVMLLWAVTPAFAHDVAPAQTDVAEPGGEERASPTNENRADAQRRPAAARETDARESLCLMIESAARANDLPLEFFARVIWQESRFQANAVGPVTRNGQRAKGIAQFMPGTASERRLLDPFDPVQALPKSAEFLRELRNRFGNLGLAAAAYNAGPKRVQDWLAGSGYMPQETRNYVAAITGSSVDDWVGTGSGGKPPERPRASNCRELIALLNQTPNRFVTQLEHRVTLAIAKPWGVQVAAGFGRENALVMYARATKGLSAVIGNDPGLIALLFRSRGTSSFYQVRIGANTRRQADNLCSRIRRTGGACLVKRNQGAASSIVPPKDEAVNQPRKLPGDTPSR